MSVAQFNQSVIQAVYVNNKKQPLDDPRVRRALHLAFDRPTLVDAVKDITPMRVGGFIYPFSEFATPPDQMSKRLGYQEDPGRRASRKRKALWKATGRGGFCQKSRLHGTRHFQLKVWSQAIQAMLQEALGVQCNLRTVVELVWFDDTASGNYDLAIGAVVSTLLDPSDYFNAWYRTGGPQNYSKWSNAKFDTTWTRSISRSIPANAWR